MTIARLYLSNDTSSLAAGAGRLVSRLEERSDIQLVRTSSRGAFYLEPMIERDGPDGRLMWPQVTLDDLPGIIAGTGGIPVGSIPYLAKQMRVTFSNLGITEPPGVGCIPGKGRLQGPGGGARHGAGGRH
jgi:formate dehydrogenase iron-sulfur subunit